MELKEALEKAKQILDEERLSPTVEYSHRQLQVPKQSPGVQALAALAAGLAEIGSEQQLHKLRSERPRAILEDTNRYQFNCLNYNLLSALMHQVPPGDRIEFVESFTLQLVTPPGCAYTKKVGHPSWEGLSSELPLIAEFMIRNAAKEVLMRTLAKVDPILGHVHLLRHLEEMVALNFTLLSDNEYDRLSLAVNNYQSTAYSRAEQHKEKRICWFGLPPLGNIAESTIQRELLQAAAGIKEQCRKARYLYLKGSLLEGLNLEVNQDKTVVESYLRTLGFSTTLLESLNQADLLYHSASTPFEFKNCMGHLRSFLECLHREAIPPITSKGIPAPDPGWGPGLIFLRQNDLLTQKQEQFAAALFGLISDEAVHPLIAEREYARLARNVIIEYALLFLRRMAKMGLKRS
jgi:hypothetical protein